MYTVSNEFKEMVKSNAVVATARITLVADGTVLDGNNLASVSIKDYCNNNGAIIGTTMCKEAEIEIINNGYDLADKELLLEVGVEVAEDTIEYIPYGNFIVKEYTDMKSNNRYKIVAYDYMDKLNKEFTDNNTYPMTLQAFYEAFATQYGVQIETQTLPNQEFIVKEKPFFDGATGRTVLSAIAQMFGSFAKFNRNNKIQMYLKNETSEQISREQMNSKLEIDNRYGPLNTVVLRLGEVEGENVTLKDNNLANSPKGKNLLNLPQTYTLLGAKYNQPISLPAGTYKISAGDITSNGTSEWYLMTLKAADNTYSYVYFWANKETEFTINFDAVKYDIYSQNGYVESLDKTTTFNNLMISMCGGKYEPFEAIGEVILEITDNPFVYTQELREQAIQGIYDRVLGFTYVPTSFNYKAYLYLDCGDMVKVQHMNNDNYIDTIILNQEIKVPATRKSKCENLALTKTQVTNQFVSPEKQAQRKTEIMVDKQNQEIKALVTKTDDQGNKITQIVADLGGVTTRVESTETRIGDAEEDIDNTNKAVSNLDKRVTEEVNNLQGQIDGAIQFWNGPTIPTLDNQPASSWQTEEERNNHRADIYTVIEDVDGEMKQGKSYRFDKVGPDWVWVELTDNELSAVQALAESKAKVFVIQPKPPYNLGDLWLKDAELYECIVKKDGNGAFVESDWQKATKYTDDTIALLAQAAADKAIDTQTITTTTDKSKYFHLSDSADSNCKTVEIFGESIQNTRSGKNILYWTRPTFVPVTENDDGSFYFNYDYAYNLMMELTGKLKAGTYTITNYGDIVLYVQTAEGDYLSNVTANGGTRTFTYDGTSYLRLLYGATTPNTSQLFKVQLEEGSTATEYEAFGKVPSREFPSEIKSTKSKNLFDIEDWYNTLKAFNPNYISKEIIDGIEYVKYHGMYHEVHYMQGQFKENTQYTLTFQARQYEQTDVTGTGFTIYYTDGTNVYEYIKPSLKEEYYSIISAPDKTIDYITMPYNYGKYALVRNIQLEEKPISTFYVPYNHIGYKSVGKNLFNVNHIQKGRLDNGNKGYGSSTTKLEVSGNTITFRCNSPWRGFVSDFIKVEANKVYRISYKTDHKLTYYLDYYDKDYKWIRKAGTDINTFSYMPDGTEYCVFSVLTQDATTNPINTDMTISDIQIEYGNTITDFEEYKENICTFALMHEMGGLYNDISDNIVWDKTTGKWYNVQRITNQIFGGTEGWYQYGINVALQGWDSFLSREHNHTTKMGYMCNIATEDVASQTEESDTFATHHIGDNSWIVFNCNMPVDEWKAYLTEQYKKGTPVMVQFDLAEPIITEITEPETIKTLESIRTYKEITYIEADALSILTYYRNVPIVEEYETKASAEKKYKVTEEKFAEQKITNDGIISTVSEVKKTIAEDYMTKEEASTQYSQLKDAFVFDINEAISDLKEEGISKVVTTEVTIDNAGITVGKSDSDFTNTMNNTGTYQYNAGQLVAKYDKDGAEIPRLKSDFAIIAGLKYTKEDVGGVIHHKIYVLE